MGKIRIFCKLGHEKCGLIDGWEPGGQIINKLNRKVYNTNQKKMQYIKSSFGGIIIKLCILNIQLQKYLTFQITTTTTTTTVTTTTATTTTNNIHDYMCQ